MGSDGDNRLSRLRIVIETIPEIQTKPSLNNNKRKSKKNTIRHSAVHNTVVLTEQVHVSICENKT